MSDLDWMRGQLWPWLLALPLLWLVLWRLLQASRRGVARYGAVVTERARLPGPRATLWTTLAGLLLLTGMEPQLGEEKVAVERRGLDVLFCLDVSRSMLARDLEPNRLARAKRDIRSVLTKMVGGDRVGLVVFAGKTRVVVPLTHDIDSFEYLLEQVDSDSVRTGGSDLGGAIRAGLGLIDAQTESTSVIALLTDGEDLTGAGRQAAAEARARGVVVHAVGYGSSRGSKIVLDQDGKEEFLRSRQGDEVISTMDSEGLRAIAQSTGGEFVRADVMPLPLVELKEKRMDPVVKRAFDVGEEVVRKSRFQWVLLPAVLLLIVEVLRSGGRRQ